MPDDGKRFLPVYNLEKTLRKLGSLEDSFVIGIFDCQRESFDEDKFRPGVNYDVYYQMGRDFRDALMPTNLMLIFAYPPLTIVNDKS